MTSETHMTDRETLSQLNDLLGPTAWVRQAPNAPVGAARDQILESVRALQRTRNEAKVALDARRDELLSDPAYQRLLAEYTERKAEADAKASALQRYHITVGTRDGACFIEAAHGDTWDEVFEQLKARQALAASGAPFAHDTNDTPALSFPESSSQENPSA